MSTGEITITHGDRRVYEVRILDEVTGDYVDLDTGSLEVAAKELPTSEETIFVKTTGDGIDHQDQSDPDEIGLALLTIDADDLAAVDNDWHRYHFDVRFIRSGTDVQTPIRGTLRVIPSMGEGES